MSDIISAVYDDRDEYQELCSFLDVAPRDPIVDYDHLYKLRDICARLSNAAKAHHESMVASAGLTHVDSLKWNNLEAEKQKARIVAMQVAVKEFAA